MLSSFHTVSVKKEVESPTSTLAPTHHDKDHKGSQWPRAMKQTGGKRPTIDDGDDEKEDDDDNDDPIERLCRQFHEINVGSGKHEVPPIYTGTLQECSVSELIEKLNVAYQRWFGEEANKLKFYARAHYVFGLDMMRSYVEDTADQTYAKLLTELTSLNIAFERMRIMDMAEYIIVDYQNKFNQMYELLYNAHNCLVYACRGECSLDPARQNITSEKENLFKFQAFSASGLGSYEQLLIYIQHRASENHYRKVGDMLYEERKVSIRNPDTGELNLYGTYSWIAVCKLKSFIIRECNPRTNNQLWRAMHDKGNLDKLVKFLSEDVENEQIPDLRRDRTITAWRNGLWFAEYAAFYPYTKGRLPSEVVAAQYIDQEFDTTDYGDDFMKIPCVVKKILGDQDFTLEDQSFILGVAFGRLIFQPGKYDRWEIIPFLWGLAQTGKSCLLDACIKLFDAKDVQGVGNNFEKQFGLQDLVGKMLWAANDVKKNFAMDAGDLQTIVSLELMSVACKYKNALSIQWDVPGIIAGNEIPQKWTDALGALERRILLIDFPNSVVRDNQVKVDLENERSLFYRIITYAYHYWQRKCGDKNIWDYAPRRFREARKIIKEHENPLEQFLNCPEVEITKNPDDYLRETYFKTWFSNWRSSWGQQHKKAPTPEDLRHTLKNRGVKIERTEKPWPLGQIDPCRLPGCSATSTKKWEPSTATDYFYYGIKLKQNKIKAGSEPLPSSSSRSHNSIGGTFSTYAARAMVATK